MPQPLSLIARLLETLSTGRLAIRWSFAAALIPGLLAGWILFYGIYQSKRNQLEESALQTARALVQTVDAELFKTQTAAQTLSESGYLTSRNFPSFYKQAKEVLELTGMGTNIVVKDITGQQIVNTIRPLGTPLPLESNHDMVHRVFQTGRPVISDLFIGPVQNRYLISVNVPVFIDGKIAYDLRVALLPEYFNQLLLKQKLPAGWIAAVFDTQKAVVARSQNPTGTIGKKATPDLLAQMNISSEGRMASHSLDGVPTFVAFSRSQTSNWTVSVGMTRAVLYTNLYGPLALAGFTIVAFLVGGVILAVVFGRQVREALQALGVATEAAALGDLDALAPLSGPQEIARLAAQFNQMQKARKEAEAQLRLAASVFSAANEGIIITDQNINIIAVNQAFIDISGYRADEVIGKNPRVLRSDRHAPEFYADLWQSLTKVGQWQGEIWNRHKNGIEFAAHMTISITKDASGNVDHYVALFSDVTAELLQKEEIERLAYYDPLTHLPNRRLLSDRIQQALSFAERLKVFVAVCYLDLDGFKPVNDTYGHKAGDQVLVEVARRLKEAVRAHDTVSRLGGDEFVLLLTDLSLESEGDTILTRVLQVIAEPFTINHEHVARISASIGTAYFPKDAADSDALLRYSDQAMYQAKHGGRNQIRRFIPDE